MYVLWNFINLIILTFLNEIPMLLLLLNILFYYLFIPIYFYKDNLAWLVHLVKSITFTKKITFFLNLTNSKNYDCDDYAMTSQISDSFILTMMSIKCMLIVYYVNIDVLMTLHAKILWYFLYDYHFFPLPDCKIFCWLWSSDVGCLSLIKGSIT